MLEGKIPALSHKSCQLVDACVALYVGAMMNVHACIRRTGRDVPGAPKYLHIGLESYAREYHEQPIACTINIEGIQT